ncbi:nucleotide kinase domain-containing protein [Bacillus subtilis]|uniref:nucleotide kinase domain-containing protein n=1 Tax=Bacillus subtilis TaxID=1423 RepID=UPI0025CAB3AB|nr:nucleotide kinase domain-containing protein [Bacillus subtilis]GLI90898.1 hypothetical protein ANABIO4_42500 [Bacillus subtilis]
MKTKEEFHRIEVSKFTEDMREAFGGKIQYRSDLVLVNIRGCNGAGKSTVPMQMLQNDPGAFMLTVDGKDKATVFPSYGFVAMGRYFSKTGGLDGFKNNEETLKVLELLWELPFSIIMEGVISSTIFSTYCDLFKELEKRNNPKRAVGVLNLLPPFEVCLERIKKRTPEKFESIKKDQIEGKWRTVNRNAQKFRDAGVISWDEDNSVININDTVSWFFSSIKHNLQPDFTGLRLGVKFPTETPVKALKKADKGVKRGKKDKKPTSTVKAVNNGDGAFLRSLKREIRPHWDSKYINTPDDNVRLRRDPETGQTLWDMYFINLVERQNIWYRRVVQGKPKPWTDDPVMSTYHFTNVDRRLDRVTLHYIDKVLCNLEDSYESKKFLLLNTFIYRLFVRPETTDAMGYIFPETFEEDWERAKAALRARRESGEPVFTDAYFVNDLKSANPDRANSSNKTENAIHLIQFIIDHLDELAEFTFDSKNSMEEVIEKFTMIPAVGNFNAYEVALDLGIVKEMTGIDFVDWTPDHYANVGPGCKKGIEYVFEDLGNMSHLDIVFFITSVYKGELERLGLEYKYQEGCKELDLRALEGWCCEMSKYFNYYATERGYDWAKGKRPKKKMNLRTDDVNYLNPRISNLVK